MGHDRGKDLTPIPRNQNPQNGDEQSYTKGLRTITKKNKNKKLNPGPWAAGELKIKMLSVQKVVHNFLYCSLGVERRRGRLRRFTTLSGCQVSDDW